MTKSTLFFIALALAIAPMSFGTSLYFQGFETDTSGWYPDTSGTTTGTITRVPSGGGTLGLTAADGSYYAEVTNSDNSYQPATASSSGYGTGGYSLFGNLSTPAPYPGSSFTQSIDVYVNTLLTMGPGVQDGFWIDDTPSSTAPIDASNGGFGYGAEHNFRLAYSGSSVGISLDNEASPLYTVTTSGWYDFEFTYSKSDSDPTDISNTTLAIATVGGTTLASQTLENDSDGETLENQYLAGPGYTWLPVWANGFSNDTLGIDDVQAYTTTSVIPEPSSFVPLGAGLAALAFAARRKRRSRRSL